MVLEGFGPIFLKFYFSCPGLITRGAFYRFRVPHNADIGLHTFFSFPKGMGVRFGEEDSSDASGPLSDSFESRVVRGTYGRHGDLRRERESPRRDNNEGPNKSSWSFPGSLLSDLDVKSIWTDIIEARLLFLVVEGRMEGLPQGLSYVFDASNTVTQSLGFELRGLVSWQNAFSSSKPNVRIH